ncbi:MAG: Gfo/Idh/MocA family oxidoreductase [Verrucomicrobia bacterium]|nr:Gfo/Idh/MocA family oxidoreductase [Verrucomicrobiota bacterium]
MKTICSRREFLKHACRGAAVAPFILQARRAGAAPANERITMACIGVGNQGGHDTRMFLADPRVQIVASCDVDLARAKAMAATIEDRYAKQSGASGYKGCEVTQDFRELIARRDIDTVMIATPDHTHAVIAIAAARHGKDIYCEKPLAYSVAEGRAICETVKRHGHVLQTGTQRRSVQMFRHACELVRNGRIGKLNVVRCIPGRGFGVRGTFTGQEPPESVPADFNYDLWLGPAPWMPYTAARCHFNFRWILDYGEGYISDNGVHAVDLATWGMGVDLTGPEHIDGKATFPTNGIYDAPTDFEINYRYANGMRLVLASGEGFGVRFEGSEGWLHMGGWDITASSESILASTIGPDENRVRTGSLHHADFIDCVLSRRLPTTHAELGQRAASVCHLGFISCRLGRPLKWDPAREVFPDDASANRLLSRAMRAPWSV